MRRAQRIVEAQMEKRELPVPDSPALPAERPWHEKSRAEKLAAAADRALDVAKAYLDQPVDPGNVKLASLQANLALEIIGYQIRVESGALSGSIAAREPVQLNVHFVRADNKDEALPRIASQAEYDALPSGRHFIAPDGTERVKP